MVYGEPGRFPLQIIIKMKILCYWTRLLENGTQNLSALLKQLILKLHNLGTTR